MAMNLLTIKQFLENHKEFTEGGVRWWIFNANKNGFNKVIKKIGRRVYINEPDFFAWVEEINGRKGA